MVFLIPSSLLDQLISFAGTLIHVYLGGTGSSTLQDHTVQLWLSKSSSMGFMTIALSYIWANYADKEKNEYCKNRSSEADAQQSYISEYHKAVLFGGTSDLISVSPNQSVVGRLKSLILKLVDQKFNLNVLENAFTLSDSGNIELKYENFIFSGHSQGASHVAYLSKCVQLRRAILFSGPQDLISRDENGAVVSWLQGPFKTPLIYAFMHAEEEGTADLIRANWRLMEPLGVASHQQDGHIGIQIYSSHCIVDCALPWCWGGDGIGKSERDAYYDRSRADEACTSHRCFYSSIPPATATATAAATRASRPNHGSTVTDNLTPKRSAADGLDTPIYADDIWEILLADDS